MKTFAYRGYDNEGRRVKGVVEALDVKDAREKLTVRRVLPESVLAAADARSEGRWSWSSRHTLTLVDQRAEFYRALAMMVSSGLPLVTALEIQLEQTPGGRARLAMELAGIRDRVRDGDPVTRACEQAGVSLSPFESAVLESGERTGNLHVAMQELAGYLDDVTRVRQAIRTACLYPAIIVLLALVVGTGVLGFLVPQMATVFEEAGMSLPVITRLVVALGAWFFPLILPLSILLLLLVVVTARKGWQDPSRRRHWERTLFRFPFFGAGLGVLVSLRFARTSALLLKGGLPLVDTFRLSGKATGSYWLAEETASAADMVRQGSGFSRVLGGIPVLGAELGAWVRAGESSGNLDGMFQHASERLQQRWDTFLERTVALIEPALIVLVALFVLLIALAILLPILSLNQQLT